MSYVDGFVVPVPAGAHDAYEAFAAFNTRIFKEHGALKVVECWGDDVPKGKVTDFHRAVAAEEGEGIVFAWIVWPSREARDEGMRRVMEDPRVKAAPPMPFDGRRLIFGGFEPLLGAGDAP